MSDLLADRLGQIITVCNKSLETFGDKLSIKHTPMLHQEGSIACLS